MPANKKYLTGSFHQRFAKITAGILGGYLITSGLFLTLALWIDHAAILYTMKFGGFIVWCGLLIVPFLFKNGWKAWGLYLLPIGVFTLILYLTKTEFTDLLPAL